MRAAVVALAFLAAVGPARAATFSIGAFAGNIPIIDMSGPIEIGDDGRFNVLANALRFAVVRLDSRGGQVGPAINIGLAIRRNAYSTYVSPGHMCASACGLIWLAGSPHGKDETAMVGFHGAYLPVNGQNVEVGPANAAIGAYLDQLHYDMKAIVYVTTPLPDQMAWITRDSATLYDLPYDTRGEIETSLWSRVEAPPTIVASVSPQIPTQPVAPIPAAPPMQLPSAPRVEQPADPVLAPKPIARAPITVRPKPVEEKTVFDALFDLFGGSPLPRSGFY